MGERLDDAIDILRNHAEGPGGPPNYHTNLTQLESHVVCFESMPYNLIVSKSYVFTQQPSPSSLDMVRSGAVSGPNVNASQLRCDSAPPPTVATTSKKSSSARSTPNANGSNSTSSHGKGTKRARSR